MISIAKLYHRHQGICAYCETKISRDNSTRDHVVPRIRGGSNSDENIVLACRECNRRKDSLTGVEWKKRTNFGSISESAKRTILGF